ncbi:MAG: hypothetical protein WCB03_02280 [Rouxiella badensis]|uniref:Uncharacterized protein n=1 Tax=Rouxiella badensis TaxID=1646377 RepID=A0A1X0WAC9_9GAMM|nr:hypothetical protein [Rouxiella badensis]ORJ23757.1 hypothetical protein BS640_19665 [Rouxiella badensis]QOI54796.1 hypothetical protein H2866_17990 [Rouxiella badensis subsp. acadiensis]WAT04120.1 hypothetical protein O1V64_17975 [Rouxiella badensis]
MADTDDVNASGSTASVSADSSSAAAAAAASLGFILVTRIAFADYQVGDEITDEDEINDILAGELAVYVIKRAA